MDIWQESVFLVKKTHFMNIPNITIIAALLSTVGVAAVKGAGSNGFPHTLPGSPAPFTAGENPVPSDSMPYVDAGTFSLENSYVRNFLSRADYSQQGTASVAPKSQRNDSPMYVTVPLGTKAKQPLLLKISKDKDCHTVAWTQKIDSGEIRALVYNLEPSSTYFYEISSEGNALGRGTFKTTGRVRMIKTQKGSNIRDIGGRVTVDGHRVRYGCLFRGSELRNGKETNVTDEDIETLKRLGIQADLDLRSLGDLEDVSADSSCLGGEYLFLDLRTHGVDICSQAVNRRKIKEAFAFLSRCMQAEKPVYMHCTWGADRTGIMAFFVECVLGFTLDDMYKDYELTSFSKAGYRAANSATQWTLENKVGYIQSHYPGRSIQEKVTNFLKDGCGVTKEELDIIRNYMLETDRTSLETRYRQQKQWYERVIAAAGATWDTTAADSTADLEALRATYDRAMNAVKGEVDLTGLVQNATFSYNPLANGWVRQGEGTQYEGYTSSVVMKGGEEMSLLRQSISDMPRGRYILKVQGLADLPDSVPVQSAVRLNGQATSIHAVGDDAQDEPLAAGADEVMTDARLYIPQSAEAAQAYYDKGLYWNVVSSVLPEGGIVELELSTTDTLPDVLTRFDNVRLFYRGDSYEEQTLQADDDMSVAGWPESDTYMNVRTGRTLQPDMWHTLCLPFDLSKEDVLKTPVVAIRKMADITVQTDTVSLKLDSTDCMKAGLPYFVKVGADWTVEADDVLVRSKQPVALFTTDTAHVYYLKGNYANRSLNGAFVLEDNRFVYTDGDRNSECLSAFVCLQGVSDYLRENGFALENSGNATTVRMPNFIETPTVSSACDLGGIHAPVLLRNNVSVMKGKKILYK